MIVETLLIPILNNVAGKLAENSWKSFAVAMKSMSSRLSVALGF